MRKQFLSDLPVGNLLDEYREGQLPPHKDRTHSTCDAASQSSPHRGRVGRHPGALLLSKRAGSEAELANAEQPSERGPLTLVLMEAGPGSARHMRDVFDFSREAA